MSRATLVNDGLFCFAVLLTLLQVMSVGAAIRTPPPATSSPLPPGTEPPAPEKLPLQALRAPPPSANAARRPGRGYVPRHAAAVPGLDVIRAPTVSGKPLWGPAPRPPGMTR